MAQSSKPDLPPEFKARCPMCECTDLDWGELRSDGSIRFVSEIRKLPFISMKNLRRPTARCTRCNYLMIFDKS